MKDANAQVTAVLDSAKPKFDAFRALQAKRGVAWPHSRDLLLLIKECKFEFSPMMIKRDRMVCAECKADISGWRAWHKPWLMHNLAAHSVCLLMLSVSVRV
jgi:hypothetical protein